jgi:hypothetical protein
MPCRRVSIRQHTSAYVSIRQHTPASVSIPAALLWKRRTNRLTVYATHKSAYATHTSAYVPHTSAYPLPHCGSGGLIASLSTLRIRQHTLRIRYAYVSIPAASLWKRRTSIIASLSSSTSSLEMPALSSCYVCVCVCVCVRERERERVLTASLLPLEFVNLYPLSQLRTPACGLKLLLHADKLLLHAALSYYCIRP